MVDIEKAQRIPDSVNSVSPGIYSAIAKPVKETPALARAIPKDASNSNDVNFNINHSSKPTPAPTAKPVNPVKYNAPNLNSKIVNEP
jgi:hypothetical protein